MTVFDILSGTSTPISTPEQSRQTQVFGEETEPPRQVPGNLVFEPKGLMALWYGSKFSKPRDMSLYMYVCKYIHIYIYVYTYIYIYMYLFIHRF